MSTAFETEMGILPEIAKAIEEMEWNLPTDIQSDAIPLILGGGDVLMAAETGSGKTGAFCLPVLQIVYETLTEKDIIGRAKTAAGEPKWRMNVFDRTPAMAIDTEAMLCQSRDKQAWHGCRANKGVRGSGKHYFECTVTDDGLCRVGWSTIDAKLDLGTCPLGFGFGGTGKKSNNRQFSEYGSSFTLGDTIGNCLDLNSQEIRWYKNKQDLGMAFKIPPKLSRETFYPAVCMKNAELRFNFGAIPMISLPESYSAVCNANVESVVMSIKGNDNISIVPLKRKGPLAIIIEPSRELAEQTFKQLQLFKKHLNPCPRVSLIVGGMDTRAQQNELNQVVDIVVGTPGRLQDLIEGCILHLESVRFFVLDECDGLLSQGHKLLIENIHQKLPKISQNGCTRLQMIVCSATLHSFEVKKLADSLMHFPQWVDLKGEDSVPETVHHVVCVVSPREDKSWQQKVDNRGSTSSLAIDDGVHNRDRLSTSVESPEMMSEAVKLLKPSYIIDVIRILKIDRSLIFCRTKLDCDNLEKMFISLGGGPNHEKHEFSCVCLHSDRNAGERTRNLDKFKNTQVRFLVCTDIAARGLDIKGLPYVINMTLPDEKENYVHRIGRVGRAERMGLAISFVSDVKEKVWYHSNCTNRGKGCFNTDLITEKGCCIWYNEMKLLSDVEEHLGLTIDQIGRDFKIETNTFDGKVVYGQKMAKRQVTDNTQRDLLAPAVKQLVQLESLCQTTYMKIFFGL